MASGANAAAGQALPLGWIPYYNLMPLRHELERLAGPELELLKGHPSVVNRLLADGKVSAAPCSSVCLLKSAQNEIALPLGVAANGPVSSVYLGLHTEEAAVAEAIRGRQAILREIFRQGTVRCAGEARKLAAHVWKATQAPALDPKDAPPLVITPSSASSAHLGRILYRLWFGEAAYELRAAPNAPAASAALLGEHRPMELLIGDEALAKRPTFRTIFDLGDVWRDLTELPFVFAVWQTNRRALSPFLRQKLLEAAEIAQARMRVEPTYYLDGLPAAHDVNGRAIDLAGYWKLIQYRLGPSHFKGLTLFLALARHLYPDVAQDDQAVANLTRWEHFPLSDRV